MNTLTVTVADPTAEIATYGAGAYIAVTRSATSGGVYAAVGSVVLSTAVTVYTYADAGGLVTDYYKWRLSSADGLSTGAWSAAIPAVAAGLCTLAALRAANDKDNPNSTTNDAALATIIGYVTDRIHYLSGRYFLRYPLTGDGTFYFSGSGTRTLWVPRGVSSVTTLSLATATGGAYTALGAEGTDFFLLPDAQDRPYADAPAFRIDLSDVGAYLFWPGYRTVKLVGVLGHATVPPEIEEIAVKTAVRAWRSLTAGELDVVAQMDGLRPVVSRAFSLDDRLYLESLRPAMVG